MSKQTVKVPDIGTDKAAELTEILVSEGDTLEVEQSIIVLETEKASVEVPSSHAGKVVSILVKEGDELKTGAAILELETEAGEQEPPPVPAEEGEASSGAKSPTGDYSGPTPSGKPDNVDKSTDKSADKNANKSADKSTGKSAPTEIKVPVPDIGEAEDVEVIELSVAVGDEVEEGDSLVVLESNKASMEIPSPAAGKVLQLLVGEGDKVKQGQQIAVLQSSGGAAPADRDEQPEQSGQAPAAKKAPEESRPETKRESAPEPASRASSLSAEQAQALGASAAAEHYAGPAVRKLARQLGIDLGKVKASGPRGRYTKDDLRVYVRELVSKGGSAIPAVPAVDFAKFGEIKRVKMSKIRRATATNMHRAWLNVPHVTQFDDADITALEDYRKQKKGEAEKRGSKLTPLPFILKACALTLQEEASFNVSLDPDGEHLIEKNYIHIGMAVDTPNGLVVPVIRDVDKKDIWQLAEETMALAAKARDGKLMPRDMQGGCFTISSLGAIGGQGFTPVVNTPEVGILGVSKAAVKPWWDGKQFVPRTMLPLCLSYDHRAINGADAGRFLTHLVKLLENYSDWAEAD